MKKVLFLMILLFLIVSGTATMNAQVKIGENTVPRKGAVLDLNGSYKGGLLLPHVEITDMGKIPEDFHDTSVRGKDEVLELAGLIVWNTGTGSEGVYVWDGKDWQVVSGGSVTPPQECPAPATPGDITFNPASIKVGETTTATCGAVDGATSYVWTLPAGLTADPLETATNELVIKGTTALVYQAGSVTVRSRNACDMSEFDASNSQVLTVAAASAGNVAIARSSQCSNSQKQDCVCLAGIGIGYNDANVEQRTSANGLGFSSTQGDGWWAVSSGVNSNAMYYYGATWQPIPMSRAYLVCF